MLFKGNETVTLVRRTTDGRTDAATCTCRVCHGCSWYEAHATKPENHTGGHGVAPGRTVKVRIPAAEAEGLGGAGFPLDSHTLLVRGEVDDPAALSRHSGAARLRGWRDCRDTAFPHLYLEGG